MACAVTEIHAVELATVIEEYMVISAVDGASIQDKSFERVVPMLHGRENPVEANCTTSILRTHCRLGARTHTLWNHSGETRDPASRALSVHRLIAPL